MLSSCKRTKSVPYVDDSTSISIGTQIWMKKNLDVDHYRNGDTIPMVTDPSQWEQLKTGAWCYIGNDSSLGKIYGKLYNWFAVNDPRGLAPKGWHIASEKEWAILVKFLGGNDVAGGKLKEEGLSHWHSPNTGATNWSGFTGLPGGWRYYIRTDIQIGNYAYWWTSTEIDVTNAWSRALNNNDDNITSNVGYKVEGMSVRCIKDN